MTEPGGKESQIKMREKVKIKKKNEIKQNF